MFPLQDETKLIEIELLAPLIIRNSQSGNNTLYRHHHNARLSHGTILAAEAMASRVVIGSSSCRMTRNSSVIGYPRNTKSMGLGLAKTRSLRVGEKQAWGPSLSPTTSVVSLKAIAFTFTRDNRG